MNGLARCLKDEGKVDEAIAEYRAALAIDPNYEVARYNLGIALDMQKKKAPAANPGSPSGSPARPAR